MRIVIHPFFSKFCCSFIAVVADVSCCIYFSVTLLQPSLLGPIWQADSGFVPYFTVMSTSLLFDKLSKHWTVTKLHKTPGDSASLAVLPYRRSSVLTSSSSLQVLDAACYSTIILRWQMWNAAPQSLCDVSAKTDINSQPPHLSRGKERCYGSSLNQHHKKNAKDEDFGLLCV